VKKITSDPYTTVQCAALSSVAARVVAIPNNSKITLPTVGWLPGVKVEGSATIAMRTDCFSEAALKQAYEMAAEKAELDLEQFAEGSKLFDFAVTSLGPGLSMDVECDTGLPVSTPAELREKKTQRILKESQQKANKIADKQRRVAETLAKKMTRKMQKELRAKK
jgi:hypothetical protein